MTEFFPLFVVLLAVVLFSSFFRSFHLPWVVALITAGIVVGPHGLGLVENISPTVDFMGQIGLIFLMFMAGLETKLSTFRELRSGIFILSAINGLIPFVVGFGIGYFFGFGILAAILLGIIFISSSIAIVIPSLEAIGLMPTTLGKSIISATIVEDVASLILLSIVLQTISPFTQLPLPIFYALLIGILVAMRIGIPRIRDFFSPEKKGIADLFQQEVQMIFVILIGTVIAFEFLGLHPIIAGFFAGLVLSDSITSDVIMAKLRAISYGFFIPIFFIVVGIETDITVFTRGASAFILATVVIVGSIASKFGSGWLAGRLAGFSSPESAVFGISTVPQLSTTLAVVFTAAELGLLSSELVTAMIALSVVTILVAPIGLYHFNKKLSPAS